LRTNHELALAGLAGISIDAGLPNKTVTIGAQGIPE